MSVENTSPASKKSRRDDMSVSEDFQQFEQKAGLDRHVIPTGFLIAFVLFSTDMSSLRDFIHSKTKRCFFHNI
jgi:hypothetical protein